MENNKVTIINEKFSNENNGEIIDGLTIMIDGQVKTMFDIIISKEDQYNSYTEVMKDMLFIGIESFINKYKK